MPLATLLQKSLNELRGIIDALISASGADGKLSTEYLAGEVKKNRELAARILSTIAKIDSEIVHVGEANIRRDEKVKKLEETIPKIRAAFKELKDYVTNELKTCKRIDVT